MPKFYTAIIRKFALKLDGANMLTVKLVDKLPRSPTKVQRRLWTVSTTACVSDAEEQDYRNGAVPSKPPTSKHDGEIICILLLVTTSTA